MSYEVRFARQALKDLELVKRSQLREKAFYILSVLEINPWEPPYEELRENLKGCYSRRLNIQHRIVYSVNEAEKHVTILRMWTHYDKL